MECFNQAYFDLPRRDVTLAWALMGLQPWYLEEKLNPGNILWRMGSSSLPWESNATSPWWISQATFDYFVTSAEKLAGDQHRLDRTFRRLARMRLAVLASWNPGNNVQHDVVVRLTLRQRARVLHGKGRFVEGSKDNVHYRAIGAFEVEQVFLPGLSFLDTHQPADVGKAGRKPVPGWQNNVEVRQFTATSFFSI
jgi:hypothetical protein